MEKFSPTIPLRIGIMAYVAVVMLGLMSYFFYKAVLVSPFLEGVMGVFYICMVLMLAIWSGIAYRSAHGNVISFSHAFLAIYIVFAFSSVGNAFSTLVVYKLIDRDFPQKVYEISVKKATIEMGRKNMDSVEVATEIQKMKPSDYDQSYESIGRNLGVMLAATALFSLLVAMFIKRSSEDLIRMNQKNTIRG